MNYSNNLYLKISDLDENKLDYRDELDYLGITNNILYGNFIELIDKNIKNNIIGSCNLIYLENNIIYLSEFFIKNKFRGNKYGNFFFELILNGFKNKNNHIILCCQSDNAIALKVYNKFHGKLIKNFKNKYNSYQIYQY